jgi:hypothetical protein
MPSDTDGNTFSSQEDNSTKSKDNFNVNEEAQEEAKQVMVPVSAEDLPQITIDKEAPPNLQVRISSLFFQISGLSDSSRWIMRVIALPMTPKRLALRNLACQVWRKKGALLNTLKAVRLSSRLE